MSDTKQIIELYSQLADEPEKDFGWDKGVDNAKAHAYDKTWFDELPKEIWSYCAAVGNPFKDAKIKEGDTVVDLGCGAGVDLLIAGLLSGKKGKVIGVDITPKMVEKARMHASLANFPHVEVVQSNFEALDLEDGSVDVVLSNGAINLTSCKEGVFAEIYRVLKPGGWIYFADMIDVSDKNKQDCPFSEEAVDCCSASGGDWANCVAGTLSKEELIEIMKQAGFGDATCTGTTHYRTSLRTVGATFKAKKSSASEKRQQHWEKLFQTKDHTEVLWHEQSPAHSLSLIKAIVTSKEDALIDVGCGASFLVDELIKEGYTNLALLDNSSKALEIVKQRVTGIEFLCQDVLSLKRKKKVKLWHDRAVFHFLLDPLEQKRYFQVLLESLERGGSAIIKTFHPEGPNQCAGLDTAAYDEIKMRSILPEGLMLSSYEEFMHHTPKNTQQAYSCFVLKKG